MIKGTHLLRSALLALLALAVISGGSLARGDLFDDDYSDCPHKTRLRDGQISDLSVNRDSDDEDHVNVSWAATDPATWGLGANAYSTSLVVILEDDSGLSTKTLSLGSRSTIFEGVDTGVEVTVQMAIVVDTADGDYLISDILEQSINQSLTEPTFKADVMQVTTAAVAFNDGGTPDDPSDDTAAVREVLETTKGTMYYVGYNENFGNYRAAGVTTVPTTPRLRIGLAHASQEDDDAREDVEFDAYIVRVSDEDDDVIPEGDDVASVESSYATGRGRLVFGTVPADNFLSRSASQNVFSNVRINDDGEIRAAVHSGGPQPDPFNEATPPVAGTFTAATITVTGGSGLSYVRPATGTVVNTIFAPTPDEHRDFPIDVFSSDETYKVTAWAINEDSEVISPVATLTVRPIDDDTQAITAISDYVGGADPADLTQVTENAGLTNVTVTEFTVLE